jgi:type II secretory pathway component PulK
MRSNEHGVALVIVLTIVALLTITVVEFTYSVQLDQHRARNALNALQARLLARSGINLAEAFLARDEEERYDAFSEDWYLALAEFCNGIDLESTTRLRCDVEDESGKININNTRPRRVAAAVQSQGQQRPTSDAYLRDAIEYIMALHNVHITEIGDQLREYWEQEPLAAGGNRSSRVPDFGSLEDFVARFRIPTAKLERLRRALTAQPANRLSRININTASADVLRAVIIGYADEGEDVVQEILERQQDPDAPFQNTGEIMALMGNLDQDRRAVMGQIFDVRSTYFRLQASALTNTDPSGEGASGIGQTLTALVRRTRARIPGGGMSQNQDIRWTFRLMDWQKEGGARLFRQRPADGPDGDDLTGAVPLGDDPRFRSK